MYFSFCRCIVSLCVVAVFTITLVSPTNSVSLTHRSIEPNARSLFELYKENKGFCHANVFCQWSTPLISEAILSSSKWNPSDPVSLIFRTASMPVQEMTFTVDLDRIEPPSLIHHVGILADFLRIPKRVRVGTILLQQLLIISENTEYKLTFTPPSFLRSGQYLLVMSHYHHNLVNVKSVNTIQISAEASVAFDRLPHLNPSTSTESTEARRSPLDADTLSLLIFNIDKLSDLCSLCSATISHKQMCDSMFAKAQYPVDLVFTSSSGYISPQSLQRADPTHSRLTTTSTCRLAHIDNLIQKLEFRYNSLFAAQGSPINRPPYDTIKSHIQAKQKSRIPSSEPSTPSNSPASSSFIPQSSAVGLYTVWDHPNIYYHFLAHLIRRYNSVINTIALHYRESSVKRERVDPINERHVLRRECENYLEDRSTYLLNLPRSAAS